ncbi:MAG: TonB-dependent receptor [Bacteroidota bacterium]
MQHLILNLRSGAVLLAFFLSVSFSKAQTVSGTIRDQQTGETVIGAGVLQKGTTNGTVTDLDGKFSLPLQGSAPYTLVITYVGYEAQEITVSDPSKALSLRVKPKVQLIKDVEVTGSRISEKQKQAALTVESMDILAVKECPQLSFYQALGTLKGVDLTTASLGFTVINTRGFNSTSPVRSLQIIDGVDNQSPGLNFSLGNFLGSPELDVLKVDLVAGASTAFFGPNAFNGVIDIRTRSPFVKPGLEVSAKAGERGLLETSVRWAQVFKDKDGEDKFGYKFNFFAMKANDWQAENYKPNPQSPDGLGNPGGFDAVNIYGDEYYSTSNFSKQPATNPGLMTYYRTGYREIDLVDYNTNNIKTNAAFHYKITDKVEAIASTSVGTGTTVYQGDNRYSLRDIFFFQNRVEVRQQDKFFIRAYATNENAGKSYDAYFTALLLQRAAKSDAAWSAAYRNYWTLPQNHYFTNLRGLPGYPTPADYPNDYPAYLAAINPFLLNNYYDTLTLYHGNSRTYADNSLDIFNPQFVPFFQPGTQRFDSAFNAIVTRRSFSEGGSRFYDKSALYHVQGEYQLNPDNRTEVRLGGNYRLYTPRSDGTIFSDTAGRSITNNEFGFYVGFNRKISSNKLSLSLTYRVDKNQNFDYLVSPAASIVYTPNDKQVLRLSFSSAIRNPTLTDQYLYYNVGRAKLVGNTEGFDSLLTPESVRAFLDNNNQPSYLRYFNVDPVRPEKVRTLEVGYRATFFDKLYLDLNAYYSVYRDFIGYRIGVDADITSSFGAYYIFLNDVFRMASNSQDNVSTQGASIGLNYYIDNHFMLNGNYSYNQLDKRGSDDPLIPAFNTPLHKFNLGFSGRELEDGFGFNVNFKWVDGFVFEGSPQFTGKIPDYGLVDLQVSKKVPEINSTFKAGCTNLTDNRHYEVFGGPLIGRLAYFSILVELNN